MIHRALVALIGLNHDAQARPVGTGFTAAQGEFLSSLRRAVSQVRPALIAEEDSRWALRTRRRISIAEQVARRSRIEHRFCDPDEQERQAIGYKGGDRLELDLWMHNAEGLPDDEVFLRARAIEIGRYFPIRERFWLSRLGDLHGARIVFICGDAHVDGFGALLRRKGAKVLELGRGIGGKPEDGEFERARSYLRAHPELASHW